MKKIIYILTILSGTLFYSCDKADGTLFEGSSSERIEAELNRVREILPNVPNGWLVEYFPEVSQSYGGYNLFLSFTPDLRVTAMSEATGKDKTATSDFSLKQSAGAVISFDTYNEVIHHFADPSDPSGTGGGPGFGLEGDFEFLILSATDDEIRLKGRKTGSVAVMTPFTPTMQWGEYLDAIREKRNEMSEYYRLQYTTQDDELFETRLNKRNLEVYRYDQEGAKYSDYYPFIVTLTGCRFYRPVVLGNESIEGLMLIPEMGEDGAFVPTNEAPGMFVPSYPVLNEYLMTKNWFLKKSGFSPYGQKLWDMANAKMKAADDNVISCYLGMHTNIDGTNYSFAFTTKNSGFSFLTFDYDLIGTDGVALKFSEGGDIDAKDYYMNYSFNAVIDPFGNDKRRTFTLTTDNEKDPSWIKFTDKDDPDNWFTVYRGIVYNPFDN